MTCAKVSCCECLNCGDLVSGGCLYCCVQSLLWTYIGVDEIFTNTNYGDIDYRSPGVIRAP